MRSCAATRRSSTFPTPLNVDGDLLPDVIATVHVVSLSTFTLRVDRLLTEFGTTPVKIEAAVDDPTAGALPRQHINIGYDARESRAETELEGDGDVADDGSDALTTLNLVNDVTGAGSAITTLGGLFDGDALARTDRSAARSGTRPFRAGHSVSRSARTWRSARGAGVPVSAQASAEIVDGAREQRIGANSPRCHSR